MPKKNSLSTDTIAAQAGGFIDDATGGVVPPYSLQRPMPEIQSMNYLMRNIVMVAITAM